MVYEEDVPKYKKKTKSNSSKSKSKSNHKHQKKECLLIDDRAPYLANYCIICGKIINWDLCLEKCEGGYRELGKEEAFKKYLDLERFTVDDICDKYVPLNVMNKTEN